MIYLREPLTFFTNIVKHFRLLNVTSHQKILIPLINSFYKKDYTLNVQTVHTDREIIIY